MTDPHHHEFGGVLLADQACPECPIFDPQAACRLCYGKGVVNLETIRRWQADMDRQINGG